VVAVVVQWLCVRGAMIACVKPIINGGAYARHKLHMPQPAGLHTAAAAYCQEQHTHRAP
jgi:hypothetical protein